MDFHSNHSCVNSTSLMPLQFNFIMKKRSKTIQWHNLYIVRVPPLKIFRESSRPIRSQDSELSTNQRPRFRLNFLPQPNLKSSNGQSIGQCTATQSTLVSLLSLHCHSRRGSFFGPCLYKRASSQCHFTTGMSLGPILCQLDRIHYQSCQ